MRDIVTIRDRSEIVHLKNLRKHAWRLVSRVEWFSKWGGRADSSLFALCGLVYGPVLHDADGRGATCLLCIAKEGAP